MLGYQSQNPALQAVECVGSEPPAQAELSLLEQEVSRLHDLIERQGKRLGYVSRIVGEKGQATGNVQPLDSGSALTLRVKKIRSKVDYIAASVERQTEALDV